MEYGARKNDSDESPQLFYGRRCFGERGDDGLLRGHTQVDQSWCAWADLQAAIRQQVKSNARGGSYFE